MFFLVILQLIVSTGSSIIASSEIDQCYQDSKNLTNQISQPETTNTTKCSEKMLVSLAVDNSQNISTEYIKITQAKVNNETLNLKTPLIISVTKTPVYAFYPLKYNQDYNSQPKEVKIPGAILSCDDSWYSNSPTCGFQYSNGSKIFDSQGFCCSCGVLDLIGLSDEFARGNICSKAGLTTATMAFCLRYSKLWYSAYEISTFSYYYNITVSIKYSNDESENIQLGSQVKVAQGTSLIARIVGDFTPLSPPPSLESFYLMKPTSPSSNTRVQAGSSAYMIVPKDLVGNGECNKIGVTYTAFRTESDSCKKEVNSCVKNQLEDFYQADLARLSNNSKPNFLISKYGTFAEVQVANNTFLQYTVQGSMSTLITLEINTTGRIQYIINVGLGKIDFAEVQNFVAKSGNGLLYAQITNTGDIASEYSTYLNCSVNIIPITAVSLYLDTLVSQIISQQINVLSDMNKSNICNFSLLNNVGTLLDWKEIVFNTTEIDHSSQQTHDEQVIQDTEIEAIDPIHDSCDSGCSLFIDISCYILNDCSEKIITFFTVIGCILLLFFLCCICFGYKRNLCCWKKKYDTSYDISRIKSQINDRNDKVINASKSQTSSEIYPSKLYYSILSKPKNQIMYLNLPVGTDPVSNYLDHDVSTEILVTIQNNSILRLQIKKNSKFLQIFQKIYGQQSLERNIKNYLETKRETVQLFHTFLTQSPLFTLLV